MNASAGLGWLSILRLGLVQSAFGAIFVLMTSTLNRVMVVELAVPAILPGVLIALQYAVQIARPRFGYGSDRAPRRSVWVIGGMAGLALGAIGAAGATWLMATHRTVGLCLALVAFIMIGVGIGASGTALLALLANRVVPARRGAAAAIVWLMMIVGFIIAAGVAGALLQPFSLERLFIVCSAISLAAFGLSVAAVWGIDADARASFDPAPTAPAPADDFRAALRATWADRPARLCAFFVFFAMLAYGIQDLILEPFAGRIFGLSPGQTTQLTGLLQTGALLGMLSVGAFASGIGVPRFGTLRGWAMTGCGASSLALVALVGAARHGPPWPIHATVFCLGLSNGVFVVAAVALMMSLAGSGQAQDGSGTRMGLWGAAQAIAFGLGGLLATGGVDLLGHFSVQADTPYAIVFGVQAVLFALAAIVVLRMKTTDRASATRISSGASP